MAVGHYGYVFDWIMSGVFFGGGTLCWLKAQDIILWSKTPGWKWLCPSGYLTCWADTYPIIDAMYLTRAHSVPPCTFALSLCSSPFFFCCPCLLLRCLLAPPFLPGGIHPQGKNVLFITTFFFFSRTGTNRTFCCVWI